MKLLVQSAMIFFGTLMAAGLVALGAPSGPSRAATPQAKAAAPSPLADARSSQHDAARSQR